MSNHSDIPRRFPNFRTVTFVRGSAAPILGMFTNPPMGQGNSDETVDGLNVVRRIFKMRRTFHALVSISTTARSSSTKPTAMILLSTNRCGETRPSTRVAISLQTFGIANSTSPR